MLAYGVDDTKVAIRLTVYRHDLVTAQSRYSPYINAHATIPKY